MDELETRITEEIAAITGFLEQQLGRQSRWNGEAELSDDPASFGKALWNGRISINRQTAQTDLRWRTQIHEALHLLSAGLTPATYVDFEGWEEGVVEQLQRLFRPQVLNALSVTVLDAVFAGAACVCHTVRPSVAGRQVPSVPEEVCTRFFDPERRLTWHNHLRRHRNVFGMKSTF